MSNKKTKETYQKLADRMIKCMDEVDAGTMTEKRADTLANLAGKTIKIYNGKQKQIELQQKGFTGVIDFFEDKSEE